jgi:hypothetical protein
MLLASLRLGFLLATLVASLHVAAAPRYWTLTGVGFSGGPHGSGYFSYDDATQTISNWNVQVEPFFQGSAYPGFTYVPANSTTSVIQPPGAGAPTLLFSATMGVPGPFFGMRQLRIAPLAALDGSNATVSIANSASREDFEPPPGSGWTVLFAVVTHGSLTLTPVPPATAIAQVDEFYHPALRHYFITENAAEKQLLDTGVHSGWQRTGESFKAYAKGSNTSGSINPVCRFYSPPQICSGYDDYCWVGLDSHFFSADAGECLTVSRSYSPHLYREEFSNAFQIDLPDKTTGACPTGTIPVYRLWNQREDSNHRYTTSTAIRAQMLAAGYLAEGYGPDGVVMCAVQ